MNRTSRNRLVFWGTMGVLLVAALVVALRPQPAMVDVVVAARGPLRVTLDHEGRTRVRERYVVSAPVAGRVLRIEIEPGDPVVAGRTLIASVLPGAPPLLDVRTRAQADAQVQVAQANLARAKAQRDEARAASEQAHTEAGRTSSLAAEGLATAQQRDAADSDSRVKVKALEAAEAAVDAAARDLDVARAALYDGRAGATTPGRIVAIRAPITGVVLRRIQESEAVVAQGEPLVEVADPSDLEIVADFLSTDAVRMAPGMAAVIERWGGPSPLDARVKRVEPGGFTKVSALGVEEQRVWVVLSFTDPPAAWAALGDGYRVETRVIVWQRPDVLKVATSSLFRHGDGWAVFAVDHGVARLRPVTIGQRNDVEAEVLGGLTAGQEVVAYPSDQITDGTRVAKRE